jgi:hypothetical protein
MSKNILELALLSLSLSLFGCAAQTMGEGEDGVDQNAQAQQKPFELGASCGGKSGIVGGKIDKYGWCCGLVPCKDPKVCGFTPTETCLNCNVPEVDCSNAKVSTDPGTGGPQPGGVYDPGTGGAPKEKPPVGGTPKKGAL